MKLYIPESFKDVHGLEKKNYNCFFGSSNRRTFEFIDDYDYKKLVEPISQELKYEELKELKNLRKEVKELREFKESIIKAKEQLGVGS